MRRLAAVAAAVASSVAVPRIASAGCGSGGGGGFLAELFGEIIFDGAANVIAAVPRIELGTFARRLDGDLDSTGRLAHADASFAYRVTTTRPDTAATAVGFGVRFATSGRVYGGIDLELGAVVDGSPIGITIVDASAARMPRVAGEHAAFGGAGGVLGVRHRFGRVGAAAEVVAGYRSIDVAVDSTYGTCALTEHHQISDAFVEPRLRVDTRLADSISMVGFAGTDWRGRLDAVGVNIAFDHR
jgi:hypothetical protein